MVPIMFFRKGWSISSGIHKRSAKSDKGNHMSKAQLLNTLPNNFVMKSDSLYCCRTGKGIMNVNDPAVSGNIPAVLAKLISNGDMEMRSYPGSFQLPIAKVPEGTAMYKWGQRQKNGPYKQLAGYFVSAHNVEVLKSVGLECKVVTHYLPNIIDIPTKPEPTEEPVVDSEYLFGGTPKVSKPAVKPANKPAKRPAKKPSAVDPLWPNAGERFMGYRSRVKAAFDLSNEDAIKVASALNDKYKAGNMEYSPVQIANAILNADLKPAIEVPAPPKERTERVFTNILRVHANVLETFLKESGGQVIATHDETNEATVTW